MDEGNIIKETLLRPRLNEEFYREGIIYLNYWFHSFKEQQGTLDLIIKQKLTEESLPDTTLKLLLDYQLEISKVMYATIALLDKLMRICDET